MRYAAFLRGINVGGNTRMSMEELRGVLSSLGLQGVTTLLNSGNAVFEARETDATTLRHTIETALAERLGRKTSVILRTAEAIAALVASEPFAEIAVTTETRLYVTFLGAPDDTSRRSAPPLPFHSPNGAVRVLSAAEGAICSVVVLTPQQGTLDLMKLLEERYGVDITTRNWNTVLKVARSLQQGEQSAR